MRVEDAGNLSNVEGLAARALKKMAGITAKENVIVLDHLAEGAELRKTTAAASFASSAASAVESYSLPSEDEQEDEDDDMELN